MPKIHVTTQGEFWDTISLFYYNSEMFIDKLIEANYKHRNIVVFPANIELVIPDIVQKSEVNAPVWRR